MKPLRLLAGLALVLLSGCQPENKPTSSEKGANNPPGSRPRVAFVTNNPEAFWTIAEAGCRKAEKEVGAEVVFKRPDSGDPQKQTEILNNLAEQDLQALAVSVINPRGQRDHLQEIAAKVPLLTVDNDAPGSGRLCYIGTDNYAAGRAVGKLVLEAMPEGGTLAVFVGQTEPLNARQRRQGLLDELAGRPAPADVNEIKSTPDGQDYAKFKLYKTYTDQPVGYQKAVDNARNALTDLKDEKNLCMVGLWAYNPPAILTALKDSADRLGKVKVVGFDEMPDTLQGIADGHITATVVQDPFGFGYQSVRLMAAIARGDRSLLPKDSTLYVPYRVITREGGKDRIPVEKFRKDLNELMGKK
jgi:ribose transport system substrate-binding protein